MISIRRVVSGFAFTLLLLASATCGDDPTGLAVRLLTVVPEDWPAELVVGQEVLLETRVVLSGQTMDEAAVLLR